MQIKKFNCFNYEEMKTHNKAIDTAFSERESSHLTEKALITFEQKRLVKNISLVINCIVHNNYNRFNYLNGKIMFSSFGQSKYKSVI
jgi:hypothetical protein